MQVIKAHGLGNDFLVMEEGVEPDEVIDRVSALCDRNRGVGADGVICWRRLEDGAVRMVIYNRDGSRPEMCGNGVRCLAVVLHERHGMPETLRIESDAGPRRCQIDAAGGQVTVDMGQARVSPPQQITIEGVDAGRFVPVDMGNPHGVRFDQPAAAEIARLGRTMADGGHEAFPQGVNLEFVHRADDGALEVIVWERGVGLTQACGTGACAVAAAAWAEGLAEDGAPLEVRLPGGALTIGRGDEGQILMRGPAQIVFEATLEQRWWQGHEGI